MEVLNGLKRAKVAFVLFWMFTVFSFNLLMTRSIRADERAKRPNILWFVVDDMSANFSCYGESTVQTPSVDALAREGIRFSNAFVTAPVCSPCRSALITGMYQTTIGSHQHRSGRGSEKIFLPAGVVPVPQLFKEAGYYTCIGSGLPTGEAAPKRRNANNALGKTDYNFEWDQKIYDSADWAGRQANQPFFMQVQLEGGKLRGGTDESAKKLSQRAVTEFGKSVQPNEVTLPPYYPRDPVLLRDWAAYLDAVRFTDQHVGKVIDRLKKEGLYENTLVVFITDHGISHARGKQFLYNEGTHIPMIVRGPGIKGGQVRQDLVQHIDLAAFSLAYAGIPIPTAMQAKDILSQEYQPRNAVFAARDRCDETVEQIRSVRTEKFLYIRNYYPRRPHLQPNDYKDKKSILIRLRELHASKALDELSERLLFSPERSPEELYQWTSDRWQLKNLAADPEYREVLESHRQRLDDWIATSGDRGAEAESMYDSDMKVYVGKGNPQVEENIALMKQWAREGK
jgi:arylsulfatase A-like enzyme